MSGYLQGASNGQIFRSAVIAAGSVYIAGKIGDLGLSRGMGSLAHGMSQGALTAAGGGRFGDGFLGGFFGHLSGGMPLFDNPIASTIQVAIIGGSAAKIGGGSFANGAISAAFVHLFNALAHGDNNINPDMCGDEGVTCDLQQERVVEEKVASSPVLVGTSSSTANEVANLGLEVACEFAKGCKFLTTMPDEAVVVNVDLMAVYEVQDVVVRHRGDFIGTFPGRRTLVGYREYRSGASYAIPISDGVVVPRVVNWNVRSDVPLYRWRGN